TRVLGAFALGHVQLFEREPGAFVAAEELAVAPAHRRLHEVHLGTPEAHLAAEQAGHGVGGVAPGDRDAGVRALGAAASRVDPRAAERRGDARGFAQQATLGAAARLRGRSDAGAPQDVLPHDAVHLDEPRAGALHAAPEAAHVRQRLCADASFAIE